MSDQTYLVIQGSVKLPRGTKQDFQRNPTRTFIMQGELLPPGVFTEADIRSWLAEGRIAVSGASVETAEKESEIREANPFRADPSTLVGKSMEDLVIMVLEIDEDYDTDELGDEADAVRLLTSGWDPKYAQTVAPVNDRSRPEALAMHKLEQGVDGNSAVTTSGSDMSAAAQQSLEAARAKAQAPADNDSAL